MFGTLYVPADHEQLEFGLADASGRRLPQPHGSLTQALLVPFHDAWSVVRRSGKPGTAYSQDDS